MNAAQITPPPCTDASFRCRRIALCKSRIAVVNDKVPRSIEASLRFPLPDGDACICGYSLDGTEAIVVTKAKAAAVAYLEKEMGRAVATAAAVQGNFWQTSIYPLPYGEEKIVEITFFCHVGLGDAPGSLQLQIPLSFLHPLTVTMSTTVSSGAFRTITQHVGGAVDTMISGQTLVSSAIDSKLEDGIRINALIADPNISVVHAATVGGLTHFAGLVSRECLEAALASASCAASTSANDHLGASLRLPVSDVSVALLVDCSRSAAPLAEQAAKLVIEIAAAIESTGRRAIFSIWSFSTTSRNLAIGASLEEAEAALRAFRFCGGADLSLLDGLLSESAADMCSVAVLITDAVDSLPGKRMPTLQLKGGVSCPPIYVPLPPSGHNANLSVLRWLCHQTGGAALPLATEVQARDFAAAVAGSAPRLVLTKLSTDLDSSMDAALDESFVT